MSRDASDDFNTAAAGDVVEPFLAVELLLDDTVDEFDNPVDNKVRVWTGVHDLTIGVDTYTGLSNLITISPIGETGEISASGAQFSLSGVPSDMISLALNTDYQGRTVNVYFGLFNVTGGAKETIKVFSGLMDVMSINDNGDTSVISMTAENRLIQLERPRVFRYTSEEQKRRFTGDAGFDFVNDMQNKEIKWGG